MDNIKLLSPSALAFTGDAVYELLVRKRLSLINRPSGELHKLSVRLVNASAQSEAFKIIAPLLTEDELAIFKRGRNFHTSSTPKHSSNAEYHIATGLEVLFGFLYLSEKINRCNELFNAIWEIQGNN